MLHGGSVIRIDDCIGHFKKFELVLCGKKFFERMSSPSFGSISKGNVFVISLCTAIIVDFVMDYLLRGG